MGARLRLVSAAGVLLLGGLVGACGDDSPRALADGVAGRGGGHPQPAGAGGSRRRGMAGGGMGGRGSPSPLPAPATQLAPGSWCEVRRLVLVQPAARAATGCRRSRAPAGRTCGLGARRSSRSRRRTCCTSTAAAGTSCRRRSASPTASGPRPKTTSGSSATTAAFTGDGRDRALGRRLRSRWPRRSVRRWLTDVWGASASDIYAVGGDFGRGNEIRGALGRRRVDADSGGVGGRLSPARGRATSGSASPDRAAALRRHELVAGRGAGGSVGDGAGRRGARRRLAGCHARQRRAARPPSRRERAEPELPAGRSVSTTLARSAHRRPRTSGWSATPDSRRLPQPLRRDRPGRARPIRAAALQRGRPRPRLRRHRGRGPRRHRAAAADAGAGVHRSAARGRTPTLAGVFGSSPSDMWAVGDAGTVLHYDGTAVSAVPAGTSANLNDVWGTGPNDVWAVGDGGTVLHYDGSAFAPVASGTTVDLKAVFTARPDDVWIGGDGPTLLHWDGTSMTPVTLAGAESGRRGARPARHRRRRYLAVGRSFASTHGAGLRRPLRRHGVVAGPAC